MPTHATTECYIAMRMVASNPGRIDVYSQTKDYYNVIQDEKVSTVSLEQGFFRYCVPTLCPPSYEMPVEVYFQRPASSGFTDCISENEKYLVRKGELTLFINRYHCEDIMGYNLFSGYCS